MHLLLDSHILIWLMEGDARLSAEARDQIARASTVNVSTASLWELAIKASVGRLHIDVERLANLMGTAGVRELQITRQHVLATSTLPLHHRDPFDRLLIAQAMSEPMHLLTADAQLKAYSELVIQV